MLVTIMLHELIIAKENGPTNLASRMVLLLMPLQGKSSREQLDLTGKNLFMSQADITEMLLVQGCDVSTHISFCGKRWAFAVCMGTSDLQQALHVLLHSLILQHQSKPFILPTHREYCKFFKRSIARLLPHKHLFIGDFAHGTRLVLIQHPHPQTAMPADPMIAEANDPVLGLGFSTNVAAVLIRGVLGHNLLLASISHALVPRKKR